MVKIPLTDHRRQAIQQALKGYNSSRSGLYRLNYVEWLWREWHCRAEAWNLLSSGTLDFVDEKKAMEFVLRYG